MLTRWMCVAAYVAAISSALAPPAAAAERSGLLHRASCTLVRFYVTKYSAAAAETWARSRGATDAEIEAARHCLSTSPVQAASVLGITTHRSIWKRILPEARSLVAASQMGWSCARAKSRGSRPRQWRQGQRDPKPSIRPHRPRRHPQAFPPWNRASGS